MFFFVSLDLSSKIREVDLAPFTGGSSNTSKFFLEVVERVSFGSSILAFFNNRYRKSGLRHKALRNLKGGFAFNDGIYFITMGQRSKLPWVRRETAWGGRSLYQLGLTKALSI